MLACVFVPSSRDQSTWTPLQASRTYEDRLLSMQTDTVGMRIKFVETIEAGPSAG